MTADWVPARAGLLLVAVDRAEFEYQMTRLHPTDENAVRSCLGELTVHDDEDTEGRHNYFIIASRRTIWLRVAGAGLGESRRPSLLFFVGREGVRSTMSPRRHGWTP